MSTIIAIIAQLFTVSVMNIAQYIESNLTIGQGRDAGKPFKLLSWQRRFLRGAFAVEGQAAMSLARANGKSTFAAAIARCALTPDAPLHEPMSDNAIIAASFAQGGVIFRHLLHFLRPELERRKQDWRLVDSANQMLIEHRPSGARMQILGHNPRTMHGLAPRLLIADELAQWQHTQVEQSLAALTTSMGKIPDSRILAIGTRPADPDHPFQRMLDGGADFAMSYAARANDPKFQRRTWKRANPSLDSFPDLEKAIRREADAARRDASLLPQFDALRLNLGVSDTAQMTLLDADTWERLEVQGEVERKGAYILGVDLGAGAAMSAAAGYWPASGALDCFAVFPTLPTLPERGLRDGVGSLYVRMNQRGELHIAGERVADIPYLLRTALAKWGSPEAIVTDRWREAELRQTLDDIAFPYLRHVFRGMGFKDGGEDVRLFRAAALRGEVRPPRSLLLRAGMANARVAVDPAGNSKLIKTGSGGGKHFQPRDDAVQASILAVAEGVRAGAAISTPSVRFNVL